MRVDPILDGNRKNTIVYDDAIPVRSDPELDPFSCAFRVKTTPIEKPGGYDLDSTKDRVYKIINPSRISTLSGKPAAGYELHAIPSQMIMMGEETFNYRRGLFASRPIWVTRYPDDELWAAGEFTNQSREDTSLSVYGSRIENVGTRMWSCGTRLV